MARVTKQQLKAIHARDINLRLKINQRKIDNKERGNYLPNIFGDQTALKSLKERREHLLEQKTMEIQNG